MFAFLFCDTRIKCQQVDVVMLKCWRQLQTPFDVYVLCFQKIMFSLLSSFEIFSLRQQFPWGGDGVTFLEIYEGAVDPQRRCWGRSRARWYGDDGLLVLQLWRLHVSLHKRNLQIHQKLFECRYFLGLGQSLLLPITPILHEYHSVEWTKDEQLYGHKEKMN